MLIEKMCRINEDNILKLNKLKEIPKSDLHNHASYGGNIMYLSDYFGVNINSLKEPFHDLREMRTWFDNNINIYCRGMKGYLKRIQAAFVQAVEDNIILLSMSFSKAEIDAMSGMKSFISIINGIHKRVAPSIVFMPELALQREVCSSEVLSWIDEVLEYDWFRSIDICGDENAQPIKNFIDIYRIAEKHHLMLKAHVGEFGNADDIREAVEELHLSEVHHGIAAVESVTLMRWLAKEKIQLNICPTSNIMLSRVANIKNHPIRIFFDYGIPVTLNTDDMLIFNSSVSQEYMKLFQNNIFTSSELEIIRQQGLKYILDK
ncbi:MAG: adenosine deaminase [Eisenbergiella massiliensis]|uniref:adenosine deaminase n=1 Tax=Eisenbergiella massiliensis TaxID=1720294 RepID=UPI003994313D